jgi:RNA polymerase sigma-70 factor (ECF subfamily)
MTVLAATPGPKDVERDLVLRAQAFDEEALSALFASYYPRMYTYGLAQLRSVHTAEDFASDVILRVLDGIRRYRLGEQPFSAWVFRIARNRLIDLQRRRTRCRQVPWDENIPSVNGHGQGPMKQVLDIDEIRLGLADLTEAQAQVIVLRFQQDLDVGTVARVLGRSERAVKSLQFRALAALRRTLSESRQPVAPQVAVPTG